MLRFVNLFNVNCYFFQVNFPRDEVVGASIIDLFLKCNLGPSRSSIRRTLQGGGLYLNDERITDAQYQVSVPVFMFCI